MTDRPHRCESVHVKFQTPDENELAIQAERVFRVAQDVTGADHLLCGDFVRTVVGQLRKNDGGHAEYRCLGRFGFGGKIKASSRTGMLGPRGERETYFWFSLYPEDGNEERDKLLEKCDEILLML